MSEGPVDQGENLDDIAIFLSGVEAFRTLGGDQLARLAASVTPRRLRAGEALIVEGGHPSTQLWVLRDGALDLLRRDHLITSTRVDGKYNDAYVDNVSLVLKR